jgi:hypothetical protein
MLAVVKEVVGAIAVAKSIFSSDQIQSRSTQKVNKQIAPRKTQRIQVIHGDVLVWGGSARLRYHGIASLKDGQDPRLGRVRYNLTFRNAS